MFLFYIGIIPQTAAIRKKIECLFCTLFKFYVRITPNFYTLLFIFQFNNKLNSPFIIAVDTNIATLRNC